MKENRVWGLGFSLIKITLILFIFLYPIPQTLNPIFAHSFDQPPFFKVNGEYSNLYPVPISSLYNFDLPQDLAPGKYLVNQPINFEFDTNRLPAPPDIVKKTKFDWDFTDGTHSQGLKNIHTFTQIGSYIIKIYADDGTTPKPQLLESVLVNVLPDKNYALPQAKISVNNKASKDPLTDVLTLDFANPVQFDASKSSSANEISEYFWDFGDQKSAYGATQTHNYPKDLSQVFIVLRVKDNNGFLADNFVEVQNQQNENQHPSTPSAATIKPPALLKKPNQLPYTLGGLLALGMVIIMARQFVLGRRRGKHQ